MKENPPAVRAGYSDYPFLLAQALYASDWRSPQSILLGTIECRSPDPLTVTRVGKHEVWHREVRLAILELPEAVQANVWSYLHAEGGMQEIEGKWHYVPPALMTHHERAFGLLWRSLVERSWLHERTYELGFRQYVSLSESCDT